MKAFLITNISIKDFETENLEQIQTDISDLQKTVGNEKLETVAQNLSGAVNEINKKTESFENNIDGGNF